MTWLVSWDEEDARVGEQQPDECREEGESQGIRKYKIKLQERSEKDENSERYLGSCIVLIEKNLA